MTSWKKVSMSRILSGRILLLSRSTGCDKQMQRSTFISNGRKLLCQKVSYKLSHWYHRSYWGCEADLWWSMKRVRVENGLDHDEGLGQILSDKVMPVIWRLIRTVVKHLQKWRPSQVEHELGLKKKAKGFNSMKNINVIKIIVICFGVQITTFSFTTRWQLYLWVERQRLWESERCRILFIELPKFLTLHPNKKKVKILVF